MAKNSKLPKTPEKPTATEERKLLELVRKRASAAQTGDKHNREQERKAKRFLNGEQWEAQDLAIRTNRPSLVIDHINQIIDGVMGDQRLNLPGLKVRPADSKAQPEWAQIKEAKIRHITAQLNTKMALDKASETQLQGGIGYLRVITEYAGDETFEQKIGVVPVYNEMAVMFDESAMAWDRSDGNWLIVYEKISKDSYKQEYGEEPTDLPIVEGAFNWRGDNDVIVAEYFIKEYEKKTIYLLKTGEVTETGDVPPGVGADGMEVSIYEIDPDTKKPKQRVVNSYKVYRYKVDGAKILEGKKLWPSKFWPVVPVVGKEITIDGKTYRRGITKNAMDAQRLYNYYASCAAESYGLAPKSKLFATPQMISGHENQWNNLNTRIDPYTLVNPVDEENPSNIIWPKQIEPPQASSAIIQGLTQAAEDIRITSGGLGTPPYNAPSQEASGVALRTRQRVSDIGDFVFSDNLNRAFCRIGEIILDLFPTIYDTGRKIRTLGEDGLSTKEVQINTPGSPNDNKPLSEKRLMNDMTVGLYEVVIDTGPSFSTARQEAAAFYTQLVQTAPAFAGLIGDIMMRNQDIPEAQTVAYRIKAKMIREGQAYYLPPEEIEEIVKRLPLLAMPQKPNPLMMAKMEEMLGRAAKAYAGAQKEMAQVGKMKMDTRLALASALHDLAAMALGQQPGQQGQTGQQNLTPQMEGSIPPGIVRQ